MIEKLFIQILNMSVTACVAIAVVLLMRIFLKKAPGIFSYALWIVVLFRLLCPFSFSAAFSLLGAAGMDRVEQGRMVYISENIADSPKPQAEPSVSETEGAENAALPQKAGTDFKSVLEAALPAASRIWLCGVAAMLGYSLYSLYRFCKRLKGAVCLGGNLYSVDGLAEPFVMGIFRPRIYLPSFLEEGEKEYILLHEQTHIKRGDPAFRAVGYLALCLHWFNPLVWIAYRVSGRDMEMSCDEAVIRRLGDRVKKEYSASLLNFAAGRKVAGGAPLTFGDGDTTRRIKNVLRYKKPAFWGIAAALAVCIAAAVVLVSNPVPLRKEEEEYLSYYGVLTEMDIEGTARKVVTIPGVGEVELPEAKEVYPWFETEHFELETGDLVKISFAKDEEVSIQEIYPARFSQQAESVVAIMRSLALTYEGADQWLFSFPKGLVQAEDVQPGDTLEIVLQTTYEKNVYFQPAAEAGQAADVETVAVVPVLEVTDGEVPCVMAELTTLQMRTVLENLGFGIFFGWQEGEREISAFEESASEEADGTYGINIRRISREERKIDEYAGENTEALVFAEDCVFTANYEMAGVGYEEISFDAFADLIGECDPYLNKPCAITIQNGEIVKAELDSAYMNYGIFFRKMEADYESVEAVQEGSEELIEGGEPVKSLRADISDRDGMENVEVFVEESPGYGVKNVYVVFKDSEGRLIWIERLDASRAGWGDIYIGERDGVGYIMRLHIEDRDQYGEYAYEVFRVAADGRASQIAGSSFEWGNGYVYDDSLFREWVSVMEYYLEKSDPVLSVQDGEVRTAGGTERYNYETLSLKNRM